MTITRIGDVLGELQFALSVFTHNVNRIEGDSGMVIQSTPIYRALLVRVQKEQ